MVNGEETLLIKDPSAKNAVSYSVPLSKLKSTLGLTECLSGNTRSLHPPRPCICRLFLEGRCGQGERCKSFHVDPDFVAACRKEGTVQLEDNFLSEVVVSMHDDTVYAVRFTAVMATKGFEQYKKAAREGVIRAARLCPAHNPGLGQIGSCPTKRCPNIHVKHCELRDLTENRLRTPCCVSHGDTRPAHGTGGPQPAFVVIGDKQWGVDPEKTAWTSYVFKSAMQAPEICLLHITSRCKYGRSCDKAHVCRVWAKQAGLMQALHSDPGPPAPVSAPSVPTQLQIVQQTPQAQLAANVQYLPQQFVVQQMSPMPQVAPQTVCVQAPMNTLARYMVPQPVPDVPSGGAQPPYFLQQILLPQQMPQMQPPQVMHFPQVMQHPAIQVMYTQPQQLTQFGSVQLAAARTDKDIPPHLLSGDETTLFSQPTN